MLQKVQQNKWLRLGVNKSTVSRCLRRARQQLYRRLRFAL